LVRAGEKYEHKGITFLIREVIPYFDAAQRRHVMLTYVIIDGTYTSPQAHLPIPANVDVRPKIEEVVDYYLSIKESILGVPPKLS